MLPTLLWAKGDTSSVECLLCAHRCVIKAGKRGICGARVNQDGHLVSVLTDLVSGVQMDPVEKKPLYHFLPGTKTFSIGSVGCNFHCRFCQNAHISNIPSSGMVSGSRTTAKALVDLALAKHAQSMAFTYNEPTLSVELIHETCERVLAFQMPILLVSNGYMSAEFCTLLRNDIRAVNIDLKSFRDEFYREYCGARLAPVLDSLKRVRDLGWWLEVTTLVIPGLNDSPEELADCARFICEELGRDVPWHLSAFHGAHKMQNHPPTPVAKLQEGWAIGKEMGLNYVYMGNVMTSVGGNTYCPKCTALVIERSPWKVTYPPKGRCPNCGTEIAGIWA
ncbi:MAG: AmmeMemoRadiSam system radical SAM enzyme [Desulfovibrio sp.]|nr:AmmeMemoRadiSam system radical SAM enzyme [Desulfovibrio sp.]